MGMVKIELRCGLTARIAEVAAWMDMGRVLVLVAFLAISFFLVLLSFGKLIVTILNDNESMKGQQGVVLSGRDEKSTRN